MLRSVSFATRVAGNVSRRSPKGSLAVPKTQNPSCIRNLSTKRIPLSSRSLLSSSFPLSSPSTLIENRAPLLSSTTTTTPFAWRWYSSADYPEHTVISLPALSPTMETGNLVEWKKKEGDFVGNEPIAVVETDKSTMDWEFTDEGYLAKILVEPSEGLNVGDPLAIMVEEEADIAAFKDYVLEAAPATEAAPSPAAPPAPAAAPATPSVAPGASAPVQSGVPTPPGSRVVASPFAKSIAASEGVTLGNVQGTGPNQRIIAADVMNAPRGGAQQSTASFEDIPHSNIRKVIAQRLTQSKQQIPHYYLTIDVRMDKLQAVRSGLNKEADGAYKLSVNDFVIKACGLALKKTPACNSSWTDTAIRQFNTCDINIAVNTDSGLLTPLIPNVESLGLVSINESVQDLAAKGREGKLSPTELSTGTFTISNLGGFGIDQFCAVINPPQACILAVGRAAKKLVPADNEAGFESADIMTVTLSCDHRVVDGAVGAQWLQAFKSYMEDPLKMIL